MKKILFVTTEFADGMIPFASSIINTLSKEPCFKVRCICVNSGKKSFLTYINNDIKVLNVEYPTSKLLKLLYKIWPYRVIKTLKVVINEFNPDVVHFLTGDFTLALYVMLNKSQKYFYTVHDLHPHELTFNSVFDFLLNKYINLGCLLMRKSINNLTTSSLSQYNELRSLYPQKKVCFSHFPSLVTKKIENGDIVVKELENEKNYILFFGSVNTYKGVNLLLEAFFHSTCVNHYKLVIAGKGEDRNDLIPNDNIIRINRFIKDEEVAYLFENAAFVVYPYISASMSGVLSLAFYFDKTVVLSDIPFFQEYRCELTHYFRCGDVDDLVRVLEERCKDVVCDDNNYKNFYSSSVLVKDYVEFYKD